MPTKLDFLVALDERTRNNNLGYISDASQLWQLALDSGLIAPEDRWSPARWTGELVQLGLVGHSGPGIGDTRPVPVGAYSDQDLYRFRDYHLTDAGHHAADRERRRLREQAADSILGMGPLGPALDHLDEARRRAITGPLRDLRSAVDSERWSAAIGSAKDLVEAACKVTIEVTGAPASTGAELPALIKEALRARDKSDAADDLSRSVTATVQRLAELRNDYGTGHGRGSRPEVSAASGRLAAAASCAVTAFLLG